MSTEVNADSPGICILTGFLGSGKTTLLNRLLRHPGMDETAVLINEMGAVGIDHLVVDSISEDIVLLESGCVCCEVRDDLTLALLRLHERRRLGAMPYFKRVVLETTGVAAPGTLLQYLMSDPEITRRFVHGPLTTVVDAMHGQITLKRCVEAGQQVALADYLVLAKTDLAEPAATQALKMKLTAINDLAPLFDSQTVTPAELFRPTSLESWPRALRNRASPAENSPLKAERWPSHPDAYESFHIGWSGEVDWKRFQDWMDGLLSCRGDDLLRIKGVLCLKGQSYPTLVQSVQQSLYDPVRLEHWPGAGPHNDLIFIVQNFSRPAALTSLKPFLDVEDT